MTMTAKGVKVRKCVRRCAGRCKMSEVVNRWYDKVVTGINNESWFALLVAVVVMFALWPVLVYDNLRYGSNL